MKNGPGPAALAAINSRTAFTGQISRSVLCRDTKAPVMCRYHSVTIVFYAVSSEYLFMFNSQHERRIAKRGLS